MIHPEEHTTAAKSNGAGGELLPPIHTHEQIVRFFEKLAPEEFRRGHEQAFTETMQAINCKCEEFQNDMPSVGYARCLGIAFGLTIVLVWLPYVIIRGQEKRAFQKLDKACNKVLQEHNNAYWTPRAHIQMWFTQEDLSTTKWNGLRHYRIHWKYV